MTPVSRLFFFGTHVSTTMLLATLTTGLLASSCDTTHDYIVVGAGAGGSAAAGMLRRHGADFAWFEYGPDETARQSQYYSIDPNSEPTNLMSSPVPLDNNGSEISYDIPYSAGGQTGHYVGNQYWTMEDTVSSLELLDDEMEALDFVRNVSNKQHVHCDVFDAEYHTHGRAPDTPAPQVPRASFPMCMYGACKGSDYSRCALNKHYFQYMADKFYIPARPDATNDQADWHRSTAYGEYGSDGVQLDSDVTALRVNGSRVTGVHVTHNGQSTLACASKAVLLSAGVMGNAKLLLPLVGSYDFMAQPTISYVDGAVATGAVQCDPGTDSGGTVHATGGTGDFQGFLSTLAVCKVGGANRVVWMTPQAFDARARGTISLDANNNPVAHVDYTDVYADLAHAVNETTMELFGAEVALPNVFVQGYHWTGTSQSVSRSRVRGYDNLYVADAMGIVSTPTIGWPSFGARVAGASGALRAMKASSCADILGRYDALSCCESTAQCDALRREFREVGCPCPLSPD